MKLCFTKHHHVAQPFSQSSKVVAFPAQLQAQSLHRDTHTLQGRPFMQHTCTEACHTSHSLTGLVAVSWSSLETASPSATAARHGHVTLYAAWTTRCKARCMCMQSSCHLLYVSSHVVAIVATCHQQERGMDRCQLRQPPCNCT